MTELLADELRDLKLDGDRQVGLGPDKDLKLTSGVGTVQQSVMLEASDVLRPLVGEPIDGPEFEDIKASLERVLRNDPQIESVNRVEIDSVNVSSGTINIDIFTEFNNQFSITINAE